MILAKTLFAILFSSHRDTAIIHGEFTGANNANPTGVKFKGNVVVTRTGEGVYRFQLVDAQGNAINNLHLKNVLLQYLAPASTDGGSGPWFISDNSVNTAGHFDITTQNQAFAAADILVLTKVTIWLSPEAPS